MDALCWAYVRASGAHADISPPRRFKSSRMAALALMVYAALPISDLQYQSIGHSTSSADSSFAVLGGNRQTGLSAVHHGSWIYDHLYLIIRIFTVSYSLWRVLYPLDSCGTPRTSRSIPETWFLVLEVPAADGAALLPVCVALNQCACRDETVFWASPLSEIFFYSPLVSHQQLRYTGISRLCAWVCRERDYTTISVVPLPL